MFKYLPYMFHILFFNFRYLPFKQAIKLPILLYKPKFKNLKGKVILDVPRIKTGMIHLGLPQTTIYPARGILFDNHGTIIFKGKCDIGSDTGIAVGDEGLLIFGNRFFANDHCKIVCFHSVTFGDYVSFGWNVIIIDTDFHCTKDAVSHQKRKAFAPIEINDYNWIGHSAILLKRTKTPPHTIVGAGSLLAKEFNCQENSVILGNPAHVVAEGRYYRDFDDDRVIYTQQ